MVLNELRAGDINLFSVIIRNDEETFKLSDHMNKHNCSYGYTENQHFVFEKQLNQPGVTVWGGIICILVLQPWFFDSTVK